MKQTGTKLLEAVRELSPLVASRAAETEAARRLPAELLGQLKAAGLFRMHVPRSHGGEEVDLRTGLEVLEMLARADGSTAWTVMIGSESPHLFSLLSRERFDALYAGGPDVLIGGAFNPQGQARVEEGGYRVTGRWGFASGCEHSDWLFGNCIVLQNEQPRPGASEGEPEMRAMLFRASEVRILDTWSVLGLRGTGSHDFSVEGAFCPEEDTFDLFNGRASVPGPGFVAPLLHFVLHMGAVALGIAQGALEDVVALGKGGKRRLYARSPLAESPVFQLQLGQAELSVRAARALLGETADAFWAACVDAPESAPALAPRVMATVAWVARRAAEVVDFCYRAGGASALRDGSTLQRRFRDIHAFGQHAATAEGWFGQAGALLLGQPTGFWA